ncbi:MAG: hypothetical protein UX52_C0030G0003 [Candidatus Amesbacteria bacterium GW2011_GWA1_46_35]|uniref:Uncharacterized protein n=1 Tax=Candidatus Amesbacteria bacterium GW2011_GWC2_45_19 TaxID=1618366 RepID=A0A0G1Q2B7_9BACT|nr:MAG: hypothetical protein UX05_C0007G0034 [Candidatus Amesbacteria bacterium GW2011_GWC2_45_19]KKU37272.1 MAG: hypothetical protein UX52_C0030G0003 [Candidatus Amesbacteria bacterium GW2011_GWA1_46_35]KKU68385.1 MAG: hypothetical protein UX93_C0008G0034 [Microgenomates group bacterium GW2011_GWC1_47_20]
MLNAPSLKKTLLFLFISVFLISFALLFYLIISLSPCRNWYGKPFDTGLSSLNFQSANEYFQLFDTDACIISVSEKSDPVFPNSSERLKIGYFDSFWKLHIYPARIGGSSYSGEQLGAGLCFQDKDSLSCRIASPSEILSNLKTGELAKLQIVVKDNGEEVWEGAKQNSKYKNIFDQLSQALRTGKKFPKNLPEDFIVQINEVTKLSQND